MKSPNINLSDIDGNNGIVIEGINSGDLTGISVSNSGDLNGDGFDDLVIGATGAEKVSPSYYDYLYGAVGRSGATYVIFGNSDIANSNNFSLSDLNGNNGFSIQNLGKPGALGTSISISGDVDGDGFDDLVISAPLRDQFSFNSNYGFYTISDGRAYVIFGNGDGVGTDEIDVNELPENRGLEILDSSSLNIAGSNTVVNNAGDLNGDGFNEVIIDSLSGNGIKPATYVIFGQDNLDNISSLNLSELNADQGFKIQGSDRISANSIDIAGDLNGDGFDDLIIGAGADGTSTIRGYNLVRGDYYFSNDRKGRSYIVFGNENIGSAGDFDLANIDGDNGFIINGINNSDRLGAQSTNAGDLNGDGFADLIVSAPYTDTNGNNSGSVYVIFGQADLGNSGSFDLTELDGNNGFVIEGGREGDYLGRFLSSEGDINGDGFNDITIKASYSVYTIFGGTNLGSSGKISTSEIDGNNGFVVEDLRGAIAIDNGGDINGDNIDDLVIGSPSSSDSGEVYVIFGDADIPAKFGNDENNGNENNINQLIEGDPRADDLDGLAGEDTILGNEGNDTIKGGSGNDSLFGNEGRDNIKGGLGNDRISGNQGDDTVFGGANNDTIFGGDGSDLLIGNAGEDRIFGNVGSDRLFGGDGNDILAGGQGRDRFEITRGANVGRDIILDYEDGKDKFVLTDRFDIAPLKFNDLSFVNDGSSVQIQISDSNQVLAIVRNTQASDFDPGDFISAGKKIDGTVLGERISGTDADDTLSGKGGSDTIFGGQGNDTLKGGNGDDLLLGNSGDDRLFASNGNDTLFGGSNDDTLHGADGNDYFELTRGRNVGFDIIAGYQDGEDKILLTDRFNLGSLEFNDLDLVQKGTNVQIFISENNQLLASIANNNISELTVDDFITD